MIQLVPKYFAYHALTPSIKNKYANDKLNRWIQKIFYQHKNLIFSDKSLMPSKSELDKELSRTNYGEYKYWNIAFHPYYTNEVNRFKKTHIKKSKDPNNIRYHKLYSHRPKTVTATV